MFQLAEDLQEDSPSRPWTGDQDEFWATLALRHCQGLGPKKLAKLLKTFGSAKNAIARRKDWKETGVNSAAEFDRENWRVPAEKEWNNVKKTGCGVLLWQDPDYPGQLKELPDPPPLLYYAGNLNLLQGPCIGMVGSRRASKNSLRIAEILGRSLASSGITIVSGMACGIDGYAHYGALNEIGGTIGVLGTGLDIEYPYSNKELYQRMRESGLLLTEFAPGSPPIAYNFPIRNRIISGLSLGIIVVEAAERSGSLVTARYALEQNREIFAVPGPPLENRSRGCQNLIRNGAHPVFGVEDVLENLKYALADYTLPQPVESAERAGNPEEKSPVKNRAPIPGPAHENFNKKPEPDAEEAAKASAGNKVALEVIKEDGSAKILQVLAERGPTHVDLLARLVGVEPASLNSMLVLMEMLGRIRRLDGARYELA